MSDPDLLTYAEAAELIGCSKRTVYRLIAGGDLDPVRPRVGGPRIRRADVATITTEDRS